MQHAADLERGRVGEVGDVAAGFYPERSVVAGINGVGRRDDLLDAGTGVGLAPEDDGRRASPDGAGVRHGVAADAHRAGFRFDHHADVPARMPRGLDYPDAGLQLGFTADRVHVLIQQGVGEVPRGGQVADPGVPAVFQLVGVDHDFRVGEKIGILGVVPVGVGQNHPPDVVGGNTVGGQFVDQHVAATKMRHVHNGQHLAADQRHGAQPQPSLVRVHRVSAHDDFQFRHNIPPPEVTTRC